ncbi:MAG TPA: hypothetical protein VGZ52_02680 [Acidimicrobiales bacterium]|nr:hypothetical protein [Acidimicrobiales bacterium]
MRTTLDTGGWVSHRTSGALRELDGQRGAVLEIVVDRWRRSSRHDGYLVHETKDLRPSDLDEVRGIPCTSLVRTLIDLPAVEHRFRVEQAVDHACRLDAHILGLVRARFVQVARRGRNGTRIMREILNERTGAYIPPGSSFESEALRWIDRYGIERSEKQVKVVDGDFTAYVALAWPRIRFGMECESLAHHFGKAALKKDRKRRHRPKALGWRSRSGATKR